MKLLIKCRRYIQSQEEFKENSEYWKIRSIRIPISKKKTVNEETGETETEPVYPKRHPPPRIENPETGEVVTTIPKAIDPNDYIYEEDRIITYADIGYEAMVSEHVTQCLEYVNDSCEIIENREMLEALSYIS